MSLRELQDNQPWSTQPKTMYNEAFGQSTIVHKDFQHALVHVVKAAGNLSGVINDSEHSAVDQLADWQLSRYKIQDWVADLVICAMRMANTCPTGKFDLESAVLARTKEKNP